MNFVAKTMIFVVQYRFATDNRQNGIVGFLGGDLFKRCVVANDLGVFVQKSINIFISPAESVVWSILKSMIFDKIR